jgi:hypothetical protein
MSIQILKKGSTMKNILMVMASILAISSSAFALSANDSWNTIRSSNAVAVAQPQFAGAFGPAGLFNACVDGGSFMSMTPVRVCSDWRVIQIGQGETATTEGRCFAWSTQRATVARDQVQKTCLQWSDSSGETGVLQCLREGTVYVQYPTSFNLAVTSMGNTDYGYTLFTKSFTVPNCQ